MPVRALRLSPPGLIQSVKLPARATLARLPTPTLALYANRVVTRKVLHPLPAELGVFASEIGGALLSPGALRPRDTRAPESSIAPGVIAPRADYDPPDHPTPLRHPPPQGYS